MAQLVLAFFSDGNKAHEALRELKNSNLVSELSVITKQFKEEYIDSTSQTVKQDLASNATEGAVSGGTVGAVIGGLATLLAGVTAIAIPAAGVFVAGPLASALVGAATGATIGAVTGALVEMGLPEQSAKAYEDRIIAGDTLIAAKADPLKIKDIRDIIEKHNPGLIEVHENA